jgi:hypothetical protein
MDSRDWRIRIILLTTLLTLLIVSVNSYYMRSKFIDVKPGSSSRAIALVDSLYVGWSQLLVKMDRLDKRVTRVEFLIDARVDSLFLEKAEE